MTLSAHFEASATGKGGYGLTFGELVEFVQAAAAAGVQPSRPLPVEATPVRMDDGEVWTVITRISLTATTAGTWPPD